MIQNGSNNIEIRSKMIQLNTSRLTLPNYVPLSSTIDNGNLGNLNGLFIFIEMDLCNDARCILDNVNDVIISIDNNYIGVIMEYNTNDDNTRQTIEIAAHLDYNMYYLI